jgi:hypothetical protein
MKRGEARGDRAARSGTVGPFGFAFHAAGAVRPQGLERSAALETASGSFASPRGAYGCLDLCNRCVASTFGKSLRVRPRLTAVAVTSSQMPSVFSQLSKDDPMFFFFIRFRLFRVSSKSISRCRRFLTPPPSETTRHLPSLPRMNSAARAGVDLVCTQG